MLQNGMKQPGCGWPLGLPAEVHPRRQVFQDQLAFRPLLTGIDVESLPDPFRRPRAELDRLDLLTAGVLTAGLLTAGAPQNQFSVGYPLAGGRMLNARMPSESIRLPFKHSRHAHHSSFIIHHLSFISHHSSFPISVSRSCPQAAFTSSPRVSRKWATTFLLRRISRNAIMRSRGGR